VFSLPGCTQLLSMFIWGGDATTSIVLQGEIIIGFLLVTCPLLGSVILYWLGVSSFNAPWVVKHQSFFSTCYCALVFM